MWILVAELLLRAALLGTFACIGEPGDHAIAPEAVIGCRAPDEPDCSRCCLETVVEDACTVLSGEEDWSLHDVEPWYNSVEAVDGACAADCPRCARCSERDERELRALESRPECDCEALTIGIDPCFNPGSCACHCRRLESLMSRCPPADEADGCAPRHEARARGRDDTLQLQ